MGEEPFDPFVIVAKHTENPVTIDGQLDDSEWRNAVVYPLYLGEDRGGGLPNEHGEAMLLWDEKFLYVGIKFYDSDTAKLNLQNKNI